MSEHSQIRQIDANPQCPAPLSLPTLALPINELISNVLAGGIAAVKAILVIISGLLANLIGDKTDTVLGCIATAINTLIPLLDSLLGSASSDLAIVIQNLKAAVFGLIGDVESCLLAIGCPGDLLTLIVDVLNGLLRIILNIVG